MMSLEILVALAVVCSVVPAVMFVLNLRRYVPPRFGSASTKRVAVLIPARDEERNIAECLEHVLQSREVELEVWVLDDDSADRTAPIVREIAARDSRVGLLRSGTLPRGWNGKQHACWQLARYTDAPLMLFLDADVRLHPWAIARCLAAQRSKRVVLLSGFPRQITESFLEWLLLPLIHFVLLAYLPMKRMRKSTAPSLAAGCGQFMLVERTAYIKCGGHAAIRETRHDGLRLPQLFREHGFYTDLVDLTTVASVRMYNSPGAVWRGLAKNATEGLASPARIIPFTLLLLLGQVLPLLLVLGAIAAPASGHADVLGGLFDFSDLIGTAICMVGIALAVLASMVPRVLALHRFRQPMKSALLHPLGVVLLLIVQWYALLRQILGRPVGWRARSYSSSSGREIS